MLLSPVALYFVALKIEARRSSWKFLLNHYRYFPERWQHKPGIGDVYRQFKEFSESVVDKLLAWQLEMTASDFYQRDQDATDRLLEDPRGQLIIGSHLGNIEYCRGYMHRYETKVVNVLVYDRHAGNYVKMMRHLNPDSRINVLQVDEFDISTILLLKEKVDAGEWVFIAGDRTPLSGTERTVTVDFLGQKAPLPIGPYLLAQALACPVRLMFSYKNYSGTDHRLHFEVIDFADHIRLPRKKRDQLLLEYAQRYAHLLERICKEAPYQWFNFYDYWPTQSMPDSSTT